MQLSDIVVDAHRAANRDWMAGKAELPVTDGASAPVLQKLAKLAVRAMPDALCWIATGAAASLRIAAISGPESADPSWLAAMAQHAARETSLFPDLLVDSGTLPLGEPGRAFRFFAGTPLRRADGATCGAICLVARRPRRGLGADDRMLLAELAAVAQPYARLLVADPDPSHAMAEQLRQRSEQMLEACRLARIRPWELAAAEADGVPDDTFGPVHPEDLGLLRAALRRCLATRGKFDVEFRLLHADRRVAFVRATGSCHLDAAGAVAKLSGVAQDITDRMDAKAASLEGEKLKSIGRLTGGIAHDFNNLLTVISMNLEMLEEIVPPGDALCEFIEPARQAARSGAELTARLLAFAQRQPLRPEPVQLGRLLAALRELAQRTIGGRCTIELRCPPDIGVCLVDRVQLESALLNLIANSRDAMPAGGRILIAASNATVAEPGRDGLAPGRYVSVSVSDEGVGVPPEIIDRVFEPFFTTKPVGKGTGLGLSMVLGFAQQSGGRAEISSRPGRGTSVVLHLPSGEAAPPPPGVDREEAPWRPLPWRVLVVDDAPDVLLAMTRMCRELGLRPTAAGSAEDAIALLRGETPFDLLLTDVILPGRHGGAEVAREARRLRPSLRVLFTSGYSETEIVNRARPERGSDVLGKPFSRQQLLLALQRTMEAQAA